MERLLAHSLTNKLYSYRVYAHKSVSPRTDTVRTIYINIMKRPTLITILFALAALFAPRALAQNVGIKTNLLGWAVTNPNLGLEFGVAHHSTISLTGAVNPIAPRKVDTKW